MAKTTLWYFDGTHGECERCRGLTGYSLAQPTRPHQKCDCPIRKEKVDESDCERVLKNLEVAEGRDYESLTLEYDNCGDPLGYPATQPFAVDERNGLPSDLEDFARSEGWSPPATETMEVKFGLAPNRVTLLGVQVLSYSADLSAEVWLRCEKDGQTMEADTGDRLAGSYSKNYMTLLREVGQRPCQSGEPPASA